MSMRTSLLGLCLSASACGTSPRDAPDASTVDAMPDSKITDATTIDAGPDASTVACPLFGPPAANVGRASHVPGGAGGGGNFTLAWWTVLVYEAGKGIPRVADLDGDNAPEIVVNPRHGAGVMVFKNNGDGTFLAPTLLPGTPGGVSGWATDLGDLNGDGKVDVMLGDHGALAKAWLNNGALSFTSFDTGLVAKTYSGVGLGDVSGDGKLDALFGADQFSQGFNLFFQTASGWARQTPTGLPAWAPLQDEVDLVALRNFGHTVFADYDKDNDLDIFTFGATLGQPGTTAFVYRNDGGGTAFTEVARLKGGSFPAVGNPVQGQVGDVNGDGQVDVVAGGRVFVWQNNNWIGAVEVDPADTSHLAEVNGDCHLDLITNSREHGLRLYYGDGTGLGWTLAGLGLPDQATFPPGISDTTTLDSPYGLDVADLDGNGRLDIVRAYKASPSKTIIEAWVR